ncbi:MAG: hypothetical protein GY944_28080, partial [bacterium]|nr:hypothetical protein [bacterium]
MALVPGSTIPSSAMAGRLRSFWPVLVLALILRLVGIASESIWVDEAFSADASRGDVMSILEVNARDTHPPAYYLGLSLWRSGHAWAETDPTALAVVLRGYSVVFSLVGVFLAMELACAIAGVTTARVAGLFVAASPIDIYFADEARMYAQASALSLGGALALWHWCAAVRAAESVGRWWKPAVAFSFCGVALLFTHYVGVTLLVGQGLLALGVFTWHRAWSSVAGLALAALAVALLFSPWLAYVLSLRESIVLATGLDWMPVPGVWDFVSPIGREFFWGRVHKIHSQWWLPTAVVPLAIFSWASLRSVDDRVRRVSAGTVHLLGCAALPLLVCGVVCYAYQVIYFRPRYSMFLVPYFSIGLAIACRNLGSTARATLAVASVAGLLLVGTGVQHSTPQKRAWKETAQAWPRVDPPAFYVVLPAQHQRPLAHYLDGRIRHTPKAVLE